MSSSFKKKFFTEQNLNHTLKCYNIFLKKNVGSKI